MPLVAIVGRPNVGKSTIFNRFTEARRAITHDEPGVTRDRLYGKVEWGGRRFDLVDTGGYIPRSAERFDRAVREQVEIAIDEADVLLFIVDAQTGVTDLDQELATMLRRTAKPVVILANKADNQELRWDAATFYELGLGEVHAVSAHTGTGTGDLLDTVVDVLPPEDEEEDRDHRIHISVIGRPNVGKSSLVNAILGHDRSIVTEISGTTRDAVHSAVQFGDEELVLVDTAGLRKRAREKENVEFYATLRTERAIKEGDVAVLVIDATQGLEKQDITVLKQAEDANKGILVAVNKWDLVEEKEAATAAQYEAYFRQRLKTMDYVPIRFISATERQRIYVVLEEAVDIAKRRGQRVSTSKLNKWLEKAVQKHPPASHRGNLVRINYVTQVRESPPVFIFFCNYPEGISDSYERYLKGQLRESFDFRGVPLTLRFRSK